MDSCFVLRSTVSMKLSLLLFLVLIFNVQYESAISLLTFIWPQLAVSFLSWESSYTLLGGFSSGFLFLPEQLTLFLYLIQLFILICRYFL